MTRLTIAFDNDGTLVDTEQFYTNLNHEQGKKHGLSFLLKPEITKTFCREGYWHWMRVNGVSDEKIQDLLNEIEPLILEHMKQVRFFEGMPELVRTLREAHDVYVVTDAREAWLKELYERERLTPKAVYGLERGPHKKERLQTVRNLHPAQTPVYVCDTTSDCKAAREEGYNVIAVKWGFHPREWLEQEHPTYLANNSEDVRTSLEKIRRLRAAS